MGRATQGARKVLSEEEPENGTWKSFNRQYKPMERPFRRIIRLSVSNCWESLALQNGS